MKNDDCPICGFAEMPYPPKPYKICPCCGTEFGVDDNNHSHSQLRRIWIHEGCPWFSELRQPPKNWSPYAQLIKAGFSSDLLSVTGEKTKNRQVDVRAQLSNILSASLASGTITFTAGVS